MTSLELMHIWTILCRALRESLFFQKGTLGKFDVEELETNLWELTQNPFGMNYSSSRGHV